MQKYSRDSVLAQLSSDRDGGESPQDTFILQTIYRLQGTIRNTWKPFVKNPRRLPRAAQHILDIGTCELSFAERAKSYGTVSACVDLAKIHCQHQAGLVNAVLRRVARAQDIGRTVHKGAQSSERENFPSWVHVKWVEEVGEEKAANRERALLEPPQYVVGWASPELMTDFSTVTKGANFWVQSYSSRYVVWLAEQVLRRAGRPFSVLDLCAGKGGKSLGLAKTFEKTPEIKIAAFDTSAAQLSLLRENGRRLGLEKSVEVISEDDVRARSGTWDLVLVDAPCTGSGTWNKHPRAKWSCEEKHLAELTRTQSQLFERAKQLVRPGGSILYSVCSLFAEEGARHSLPGTAVPLDKSYLERLGADFHETPQGILIEPGNGFEGFFVALSRV